MAHKIACYLLPLHLLWEKALLYPSQRRPMDAEYESKDKLSAFTSAAQSHCSWITGLTANVEQANCWGVTQTVIQGYVKFCVCRSAEIMLEQCLLDWKRVITSFQKKTVRSSSLGSAGTVRVIIRTGEMAWHLTKGCVHPLVVILCWPRQPNHRANYLFNQPFSCSRKKG